MTERIDPRRARDLIAAVSTGFAQLPAPPPVPADPLGWPGYLGRLARSRAETGEDESVLCGEARFGDHPAVLVAFDFRFFGGSLGSAAGERTVSAFDHAARRRLPVVSLVASGGSRMQEGMRALLQMRRIAGAASRLRAAGLPHVAVLVGPVAGGAWAALAAGADVILGTPGATVCFAGPRVRGAAGDRAPASFTSDGKFHHGQVDRLVPLPRLRTELAGLLGLLPPAAAGSDRPPDVPRALGATDLPATGAAAVRRARHPDRPRAADYLDDYFEARYPLRGDRAGGADPGMLCGFGRRQGRSLGYAAQSGTANTPAGFRTAARLIRLADRLGLPVLTLVDTPGAEHGAAAEDGGIGPAIADLFAAVAEARVPITTLVIGEGGSGGALALTSPSTVWIAPDGYFSVIVPEAANAILKRDPGRVDETADDLRIRPQDLVDLGIVHGIAGPGRPEPRQHDVSNESMP